VLPAVTSVSKMNTIFLQIIPFANTAVFFCSLLELVSHSFEKVRAVNKLARDGIASQRSITLTILGVFQEMMAYKPAFHAYSVILNSFVYAYSAIMDSFVIVSFFY